MVESAESDGDISEGSFSLTVDALTGIGASTGDKLYDAGAPEPTEWVEDGELIDVVADHVQGRYHEDLIEDVSNQVFLAEDDASDRAQAMGKQMDRSKEAIASDNSKVAEAVTDDYDTYSENPGEMDFQGVDGPADKPVTVEPNGADSVGVDFEEVTESSDSDTDDSKGSSDTEQAEFGAATFTDTTNKQDESSDSEPVSDGVSVNDAETVVMGTPDDIWTNSVIQVERDDFVDVDAVLFNDDSDNFDGRDVWILGSHMQSGERTNKSAYSSVDNDSAQSFFDHLGVDGFKDEKLDELYIQNTYDWFNQSKQPIVGVVGNKAAFVVPALNGSSLQTLGLTDSTLDDLDEIYEKQGGYDTEGISRHVEKIEKETAAIIQNMTAETDSTNNDDEDFSDSGSESGGSSDSGGVSVGANGFTDSAPESGTDTLSSQVDELRDTVEDIAHPFKVRYARVDYDESPDSASVMLLDTKNDREIWPVRDPPQCVTIDPEDGIATYDSENPENDVSETFDTGEYIDGATVDLSGETGDVETGRGDSAHLYLNSSKAGISKDGESTEGNAKYYIDRDSGLIRSKINKMVGGGRHDVPATLKIREPVISTTAPVLLLDDIKQSDHALSTFRDIQSPPPSKVTEDDFDDDAVLVDATGKFVELKSEDSLTESEQALWDGIRSSEYNPPSYSNDSVETADEMLDDLYTLQDLKDFYVVPDDYHEYAPFEMEVDEKWSEGTTGEKTKFARVIVTNVDTGHSARYKLRNMFDVGFSVIQYDNDDYPEEFDELATEFARRNSPISTKVRT